MTSFAARVSDTDELADTAEFDIELDGGDHMTAEMSTHVQADADVGEQYDSDYHSDLADDDTAESAHADGNTGTSTAAAFHRELSATTLLDTPVTSAVPSLAATPLRRRSVPVPLLPQAAFRTATQTAADAVNTTAQARTSRQSSVSTKTRSVAATARLSASTRPTIILSHPIAQTATKKTVRAKPVVSATAAITRRHSVITSNVASLSPAETASLSVRSAHIQSLINEFDGKFLMSDAANGRQFYPAWAVPYAREMADKLAHIQQLQAAEEEVKTARRRSNRASQLHQLPTAFTDRYHDMLDEYYPHGAAQTECDDEPARQAKPWRPWPAYRIERETTKAVDSDSGHKIKVSKLHSAMVEQVNLLSSSLSAAWNRIEQNDQTDPTEIESEFRHFADSAESKLSSLMERIRQIVSDQTYQQQKLNDLIAEQKRLGQTSDATSMAQQNEMMAARASRNELEVRIMNQIRQIEELQRTADGLRTALAEAQKEKERLQQNQSTNSADQQRERYQFLQQIADYNAAARRAQVDADDLSRSVSQLKSEIAQQKTTIEGLQARLISAAQSGADAESARKKAESELNAAERSHQQSHAAYCAHVAALSAENSKIKPLDRLRLITHKLMRAHYQNKHDALARRRLEETLTHSDREAARLKSEAVIRRGLNEAQSAYASALAQLKNAEAVFAALQEQSQAREKALQTEVEVIRLALAAKTSSLSDEMKQRTSLEGQLAMFNGLQSEFAFCHFLKESFRGDYLDLNRDSKLLSFIYANGDTRVVFADKIRRIDSSNRRQNRTLILTDKSLYAADDHVPTAAVNAIKRSTRLSDIRWISLSRHNSSVFVIHFADRYDYLLESEKRSEIMFHLMQTFVALTGQPLQYEFGERMFVTDRDRLHHRDVTVPATQRLQIGNASMMPIHDFVK